MPPEFEVGSDNYHIFPSFFNNIQHLGRNFVVHEDAFLILVHHCPSQPYSLAHGIAVTNQGQVDGLKGRMVYFTIFPL
jgi:hypothetical protein